MEPSTAVAATSLLADQNFPVAITIGFGSLGPAMAIGFIGGLILDISPSVESPLGKWAFVLTLVGYIFSINTESIGDFTSGPLAFILFISIGSAITLLAFLGLGVILGENNGTVGHNLVAVIGNSLWTLLFAPILLPALNKYRKISLTSRERM